MEKIISKVQQTEVHKNWVRLILISDYEINTIHPQTTKFLVTVARGS